MAECEYYSLCHRLTAIGARDVLPKMEVIRMVQHVCKQTRAGCDCCDSFCVLRRSLLCHDFSGSNPSGFLAKRKREENWRKGKKRQNRGPPMPKHTKD